MARSCEMCGKGPQMGNSVETRGKAKYLGGVGTKITGSNFSLINLYPSGQSSTTF